MATPGLAVVLPTNVELGKETVMETMSAKLDSNVDKTIARPSTLALIVQRIVAFHQVQLQLQLPLQLQLQLQVQLQLVQHAMGMAMPGTVAVPPTNVDLAKGTVIMMTIVKLGSSVVKTTVRTSTPVLIMQLIVALKQVQLVMAAPMPGAAAAPPTNAAKGRETVTMTTNVSQD